MQPDGQGAISLYLCPLTNPVEVSGLGNAAPLQRDMSASPLPPPPFESTLAGAIRATEGFLFGGTCLVQPRYSSRSIAQAKDCIASRLQLLLRRHLRLRCLAGARLSGLIPCLRTSTVATRLFRSHTRNTGLRGVQPRLHALQ